MADQWVYPPLSWVLKEKKEKKKKERSVIRLITSLYYITKRITCCFEGDRLHQPELVQISFQFQLSIGSLRSLPTGD